jgi:hypothetical protein
MKRKVTSPVIGSQACLELVNGELPAPMYSPKMSSALVAALSHESPFCVTAAAGGLDMVSRRTGHAPMLAKNSGAVRALVSVIGRPPSPCNPEHVAALFRRCVQNRVTEVCF